MTATRRFGRLLLLLLAQNFDEDTDEVVDVVLLWFP